MIPYKIRHSTFNIMINNNCLDSVNLCIFINYASILFLHTSYQCQRLYSTTNLYNTLILLFKSHGVSLHICSPSTNTKKPDDRRKGAFAPPNPLLLIQETAHTAPWNPTQNSTTATVSDAW